MKKANRIIANMMRQSMGDPTDTEHVWVRSRQRKFQTEPVATLRFHSSMSGDNRIEYTRNLYHYLTGALSYEPALDRKWKRFAQKALKNGDAYLKAMRDFISKHDSDIGTSNEIYNSSDLNSNLDGVIQWGYILIGRHNYVLLQIHIGCGIQYGYSDARVFKVTEDYFFHLNAGYFHCNVWKGAHAWTTDWHGDWRFLGDDGEDGNIEKASLHKGSYFKHLPTTTDEWEMGKLYIDEYKNGYCPVCGGQLVVP